MRIGIIGAGQLGRMMALAGLPLGMQFSFLDPSKDAPASSLGEFICARYDDARAIERLCSGSDIITYEFENVPSDVVRNIAKKRAIHPNYKALEISQDRLLEKQFFVKMGIPTTEFLPCSTKEEIMSACRKIGFPCVLKTRRLGYDGKGQMVVREEEDIRKARELFGKSLIVEEFVSFSKEVSIIAVRSTKGEIVFYPLTENVHKEGILRMSRVTFDEKLQKKAQQCASKIMRQLGYCGAFTIEFFVREGKLIANEMAPRVHNSGHWTIEGATTSQFENHLRAIAGLPLGSTRAKGFPAMVNIIGRMPNTEKILNVENIKLHMYGKSERPKRKIGHVNILADSKSEREKLVGKVVALIDEYDG